MRVALLILALVLSGCLDDGGQGPGPTEGTTDVADKDLGESGPTDAPTDENCRQYQSGETPPAPQPIGVLDAWSSILAERAYARPIWVEAAANQNNNSTNWRFGVQELMADGNVYGVGTATVHTAGYSYFSHPIGTYYCSRPEVDVQFEQFRGPPIPRLNLTAAGAPSPGQTWLDGTDWIQVADLAPDQPSFYDALATAQGQAPDGACLVSASGRESAGGWVKGGGQAVTFRRPDALGMDGRATVWTFDFGQDQTLWHVRIEGGLIEVAHWGAQGWECMDLPTLDSTDAAQQIPGVYGQGKRVYWEDGRFTFVYSGGDYTARVQVDGLTGEFLGSP